MDSNKARPARKRLDEQSWRVVFERFEGAAMTVQEFCLREGLTRSVFMRWRARLRGSSTPPPAAAVARAAAVAKTSFVDLGLLGSTSTTGSAASAAAQHAALDLRIELGAGISLHLVRR